ncbi:TFP11-domain-containing protein [Epithele typhae]|uniref:TFP11-domain-containing protein n=1 Tax=Epithele typhae TaxID=378194 RepID=UPI0020073ED3|nr:TFP11-domain-containing protein [Epithele typhae]KAH9944970.1 TFP11-domain-containing protein [Epithele typhae]
MARRKREFLDDDESDSSPSSDNDELEYNDNDPDARAERQLFENPYKRKRTKSNAKEDAIYGVFGSDDDEEDPAIAKRKAKTRAKAPAFVSSNTIVTLGEDVDMEEARDSSEDAQMDEDSDEQDSDVRHSKSPSPAVVEEEEQKPRFGRLGLGAGKGGIGSSKSTSTPSFSKAGIGSASLSSAFTKGTSDGSVPVFARGGIGSQRPTDSSTSTPALASSSASPSPAPVALEDFPTAFGADRTRRSFLPKAGSNSGTSRSTTPLNANERAHFSKISGGFGSRMLQKMGWEMGQGLGTEGQGIVTPVESKPRPKGMGLAFKGFQEKTEQSKAEARRRGEIVSDDDEQSKTTARKARKAAKAQEARTEAWKKPKKVKTRVEHKTYEQILAEAGPDTPQAGVGPIIDATGATLREVSSLADVSIASWTPSTDPTRLPEIRHNLRLISESCRTDLGGLVKEARALEERKRWIHTEDARLRKQVDDEAELIARMQQMNIVVGEINEQARLAASVYEASLEPFVSGFDKLLGQHAREFDRYRMDEVVVAAIAPVIRRMLNQWKPLEEPTAFTSNFRLWRRALKMGGLNEAAPNQVQVYGNSTIVSTPGMEEKPMTPYESLLWNTWLPRIRSALNNDWSPEDPQPAVRLYEAWSTFMPPFVRDNFFDQLVLPKVQKAVADWHPRKSHVPLQTLVFPWLPHVGLRLEEVLGDARRKIKSLLRSWNTGDAIPHDLGVWKDVFDVGEWDSMLLKYVVPKLGARLREDFRVNPRQQDMQPILDVLAWDGLFRPTILAQILEKEFFPKFLDALYIWLIQPTVDLNEVGEWYKHWKEKTFSETVRATPTVTRGFTRALQLVNKALELGPDAPTRLPRPDHTVPLGTAVPSTQAKTKSRPARVQEITFRSIVEDYASTHNLLFIPTGKAHEKSRMPLYRVSPGADGKGGVLVYVQDDAVWALDGSGEYRAITLEDMVLRATK